MSNTRPVICATERLTFGEIKNDPGFYALEFDAKRPVSSRGRHWNRSECAVPNCAATSPPKPTDFVFEELRGISEADQLLQLHMNGIRYCDAYHQRVL